MSSTRRILHVVNRIASTGDGIANVCVDLACQQVKDGHQVAVATVPGGFSDLVQAHGVALHEVNFKGAGLIGMLKAVGDLRRIIRLFDPDIIHSHTIAATVLARAAVVGTRVVVVCTVHNEYQRGVILMATAHVVVGVSDAVSNAMRRRRVPAKVRTVLNGTVGSARRSATTNVPSTALLHPSVVVVGAVSHRKGADLVIEMTGKLKEDLAAHTYFVGNVDWADAEEYAQRLAPGLVHFLGFHADPAPFLAEADLFMLASRRDPAPLVLIEAMEAGCSIVAADVDGVAQILGGAGKLVKPGDAEQLARVARQLLTDADERHRQALNATRRASAFSVSRVAQDYGRIYDEFIDS